MTDQLFKYAGYSLMAEYASRNAENPIALEDDGTSTGDIVLTGNAFNVAMGYFISNKVELAGRWTSVTYQEITGSSPVSMYTLGLN